jgi:hypothetical protein
VRFASIVGSSLALVVCLVVVVVVDGVVVVVVVVQPTIAATQTPKTSGINFFMEAGLSERACLVTPWRSQQQIIAPGPPPASVRS